MLPVAVARRSALGPYTERSYRSGREPVSRSRNAMAGDVLQFREGHPAHDKYHPRRVEVTRPTRRSAHPTTAQALSAATWGTKEVSIWAGA